MKHSICRLLCLLLCAALLPAVALADRPYLIPDSDQRLLTREELWTWDYESLGYILNEIFARHGYCFIPGEKYDYYFRCMPWYVPNKDTDNTRACYPKLNEIEWANESLVKSVRAQMREIGTTNPSGQSVWDDFSYGFDTLQGFSYIELAPSQTLPVYSAPDTASWRGANGKACVSTNGNVFAAGWENGWLLLMYETNNGSVRVGYTRGEDIRGAVPINTRLTFAYAPARVTSECYLNDDPARYNTFICTMQAGESVTYLTTFFNECGWDYIQTQCDGKTVRGFIPVGFLEVQDGAQ